MSLISFPLPLLTASLSCLISLLPPLPYPHHRYHKPLAPLQRAILAHHILIPTHLPLPRLLVQRRPKSIPIHTPSLQNPIPIANRRRLTHIHLTRTLPNPILTKSLQRVIHTSHHQLLRPAQHRPNPQNLMVNRRRLIRTHHIRTLPKLILIRNPQRLNRLTCILRHRLPLPLQRRPLHRTQAKHIIQGALP